MVFHRVLVFVVVVTVMVGSIFSPVVTVVAAEEACSCYCKVDDVGATKITDSAIPLGDCQDLCRDVADGVASCASDSSQLPSQNPKCFTSEQCSGQNGILGDDQPGECMPGSFYCYTNPENAEEVKLSASIGSLDSTSDLGEYISVGYRWLIGVGTLVAIVIIMVGGLRYSASATTGNVSGAKTMIRNAVIGLVLLLSTVLILATVNPNLLTLEVPQFPMVRPISVVDENSCGYLTGVWGSSPYLIRSGAPSDSPFAQGQPAPFGGQKYTLQNATDGTNCGSVAEVVKDWEGNDVTGGATCSFNYCPNEGEICHAFAGGGGECVTCGQVTNGNTLATPSTENCAQFSLRTTYKGAGHKQINTCFYTKDATFQPGIDDPITGGTCAMMTIDCSNIDSCEDYDTNVVIANDSNTGVLENVQFAGEQPGCSGNCGDLSLKTVCNDDPCGVAPEGKKCYSEGLVVEAGTIVQLMSVISGNDCDTVDL